jgi:hypothetical protein
VNPFLPAVIDDGIVVSTRDGEGGTPMRATWRFTASGPRAAHLENDLARGTTIWLDGRIAVDDASWAVERGFSLSVAGHALTLSVVGAWPWRTRAELHVDGVAVAPGPSSSTGRSGRRRIPWWGHACSGIAIAGMLTGLPLVPLALLSSLAALRRSRTAPGTRGRVAGTVAFAVAPWVAGGIAQALLDRLGGAALLEEAGTIVWPILLLGFGAVAAGIAHAVQGHGLSAARAIALVLLVCGVGLYATWAEGRRGDAMLAAVDPADAKELLAAIERESALPRRFALAFAAAALPLVAAGEVRRIVGGRARTRLAR